jgi:hypothetical protein
VKPRFSAKFLRRWALPVLGLALIASVVAGRERRADLPSEPAARIDTRVAPRDAAEDIDVARIERGREPVEHSKVDPFRQPGAAPGAPAKTAGAPALPFRYLGKMIEDGELSIFVARGDDSYALHKGQRIDDYRVDSVSESSVVFTYVPLKKKQELTIPAVN